jgi:hypothetical protein
LSEWVQQYAVRRYGGHSEALSNAWQILQNTLYTIPSVSKSQVEVRPAITMGKNYAPNTTALVEVYNEIALCLCSVWLSGCVAVWFVYALSLVWLPKPLAHVVSLYQRHTNTLG